MSDYMPLEILVDIFESLPVKSLIRFQSVCKAWNSLIQSDDFITHHSKYPIKATNIFVRYDNLVSHDYSYPKYKYVSIVDDDTFPQHKVSLKVPPLVETLKSSRIMIGYHGCLYVENLKSSRIIGCSHGLLCLLGDEDLPIRDGLLRRAVIWNLSIKKVVSVLGA